MHLNFLTGEIDEILPLAKIFSIIHISYYTHSRAIRENIARVQGCIFTSPKDE